MEIGSAFKLEDDNFSNSLVLDADFTVIPAVFTTMHQPVDPLTQNNCILSILSKSGLARDLISFLFFFLSISRNSAP